MWERMEKIQKTYQQTYYPHVSIGWDNNPRFQEFRPCVVKIIRLKPLKKLSEWQKDYVDNHSGQAPFITLNSWNEWTETSYLEPDDLYGYGYLQAVKRVFGE